MLFHPFIRSSHRKQSKGIEEQNDTFKVVCQTEMNKAVKHKVTHKVKYNPGNSAHCCFTHFMIN